jgi:hypothetical protein
MRIAVAAMESGHMIPHDANRTAFALALRYASAAQPVVIDNQRYTSLVRVATDPSPAAVGGSRVTIVVTAHASFKRVPASPARAR